MSDTLPEADLITRSLGGDSRAFSTLCDRYRTRVWRIIASVAQGPDVDDLAQEAVLKAWSGLRSWRGDAPFEAWLCRIALHAACDYQRSAWRRRVTFWAVRPETPDDGEMGEPADEAAARRDLQRRVRKAVAALPARQSGPVWLHYFEGFSLAEVARLEGVSESTVRSRLQAGLKRLSRALHDLPDADQEPCAASTSEPAFARVEPRVDRFAHIERESKGCNP